MAESNFLFTFFLIALMIFVVMVAQFGSKRIGIPQVLGELVAGILIGPSLLNVIALTDGPTTFFERFKFVNREEVLLAESVLLFLAEIGGLFLLFEVGLEVDVNRLKNLGKISLGAAIGGMVIPFIFGFSFVMLFSSEFVGNGFSTLDVALFLGVTLTATSIGISIRVLIELGQFNTKTTQVMIGAAIIDDVLALFLFSLVLGYVEEKDEANASNISGMLVILVAITLFFLLIYLVNIYFNRYFAQWLLHHPEKSLVVMSTLIMLFFISWLAGTLFLSAIIGALAAGMIFGTNEELQEVAYDQVNPIARWLVPFFFLAVGLRIDLGLATSVHILGLALILSTLAISSKIIGSGIGTYIYDPERSISDALQVGIGMSPRGEVILVISTAALVLEVFTPTLFTIIVITMAISAMLSPLLLKKMVSSTPSPS